MRMRYVAIDIETTGLDRQRDQILQVAMVADQYPSAVDVLGCDYFEGLVWHDRLAGNSFALNMNAEIVETLAGIEWPEHMSPAPRVTAFRGRTVSIYRGMGYLIRDAVAWLRSLHNIGEGQELRHRITAAGKNAAGFDLPFLPEPLREAFHHRVLDVGSLALGTMTPEQWGDLEYIPSLSDLRDAPATHDALEDARDVARIIRRVMP